MGDDDKPFACSSPGCGMRFANEDHMIVHKMKHEMSLALTPSTGRQGGLHSLFVDQTPTPTKFLRYGEEIGLFTELKQNPFEEAFKKATDSLAEGKSTEAATNDHVLLTVPETAGTLHTPTPRFIQLQFDGANTPRKEASFMTPQPEYIPLPGPGGDTVSTVTMKETSPSANNKRAEVIVTQSATGTKTTTKTINRPTQLFTPGTNISSVKTSQANNTTRRTPTTPQGINLPVKLKLKDGTLITPDMEDRPPLVSTFNTKTIADISELSNSQDSLSSGGNSSTSEKALSESPHFTISTAPQPAPTPGLPSTAVTLTTNKSAAQQQYYLQVMVQMPSGETVPVQIPAALASQPAAAQATAISLATAAVTHKVASQIPATVVMAPTASASAPSSLAKQKLKEVLSQNVASSVLNSNMQVMSEAVDRVTGGTGSTVQFAGQTLQIAGQTLHVPSHSGQPTQTMLVKTIQGVGKTASFNNGLLHNVPPKEELDMDMDMDGDFSPKRSRNSSTEEDPDDRRRKFLERNRAAAARCRTKKKVWIVNLERKADELQQTNSKLQNEVSLLRNEVAQLKSLLLAHKDCPITLQQQSAGQFPSKTLTDLETQSDSISSTSHLASLVQKERAARSEAASAANAANAANAMTLGSMATPGSIIGTQAVDLSNANVIATVSDNASPSRGYAPIIISVSTVDPNEKS